METTRVDIVGPAMPTDGLTYGVLRHLDPVRRDREAALVVPPVDRRRRCEPAPAQDLLHGDLRSGERPHRAPQDRGRGGPAGERALRNPASEKERADTLAQGARRQAKRDSKRAAAR